LGEKREKRFLFFCSSLSSSVRYKKQKKKKKEMKRSHQGGRLLLQRILLIQHHHHQQHQQQLLFPRVLAASSSSSFSSAAAEVHTNKYGAKTNATTTTMRISYPAFQVWGSNTGVGKTLVSGGLIKAASSSKGNSDDFENSSCLYLKPVQTGFPEDSDAQFVFDCSGSNSSSSNSGDDDEKSKGRVTTGAHAAKCTDTTTTDNDSDNNNSNKIWCHTEFAWKVAAGPHVAEKLEGRPVTDEDVVYAVRSRLEEFYNNNNNNNNRKFALVETAGGVASPSSSGNLQSNVLARCRLPAILVGDGRLGGVSVTLTSYESLLLRGYDVACIVLSNEGYDNHEAIAKNVPSNVKVFSLSKLPDEGDGQKWVHAQNDTFRDIYAHLVQWHAKRVEALNGLAKDALDTLWWPFTQHEMVKKDMVAVIDGRSQDDFVIYDEKTETVQHRFDAAASWWTQGITSDKANESLHRALMHACGRYGHVMFPENAHAPALEAAKAILDGPAKTWGKRVFFSDNGSTATEVGIKMAFRQRYVNLGLLSKDGVERAKQANDASALNALPKLRILALDGSYHGDTLGAMDMQSPSIFTGSLQTPWYEPRGLFLNAPTLALKKQKWTVECPAEELVVGGQSSSSSLVVLDQFESKADALDVKKRKSSSSAARYEALIDSVLDNAERLSKSGEAPEIGGLIMEPVLHGAGGMVLIDPLFQSILMQKCKQRKIPVVLDEVFAGIWRLGAEGAWELLDYETPDISCYAKLLTGGLVPMAATVTTEEIFDSFYGPGKPQALLHGHSYTAYPIGCAVAAQALKVYTDETMNPNLPSSSSSSSSTKSKSIRLNEFWDETILKRLSALDSVERIISIGCVFAMELKVPDGGPTGYASNIAKDVVLKLRKYGIQARPIGNVLYLMASPTTPRESCDRMLRAVVDEMTKP
jgi:dethiobiotin synthetase/adenosylmethionine--8-amino-7-oxononanoate aminotransferase